MMAHMEVNRNDTMYWNGQLHQGQAQQCRTPNVHVSETRRIEHLLKQTWPAAKGDQEMIEGLLLLAGIAVSLAIG